MRTQIDTDWMENVLDSQLIIRGWSETSIQTGLTVLSAFQWPGSRRRCLLVIGYSSNWPYGETQLVRPHLDCSGSLNPDEFQIAMQGWLTYWRNHRFQFLCRQATYYYEDGQTNWVSTYFPHIVRLTCCLQHARLINSERNLEAALQRAIEKLNAYLVGRLKEIVPID